MFADSALFVCVLLEYLNEVYKLDCKLNCFSPVIELCSVWKYVTIIKKPLHSLFIYLNLGLPLPKVCCFTRTLSKILFWSL